MLPVARPLTMTWISAAVLMDNGGDETSPPFPPRFARGATIRPQPPRFVPGATIRPQPPRFVPGATIRPQPPRFRSEEHTSELQSPCNLVCRLLLEKKNIDPKIRQSTKQR